MDTSLYRKNVFKTLSVKPAKAGLRYTARNTARTNLLHASVGMATEVGELMEVMTNYLLLGRASDEEKVNSQEEMGDFAYYMAVAAKMVKAKIPGAGKKLKLEGTRGAALLALNALVVGDKGILDIAKKGVFYGPAMKKMMAPAKARKVKGVEIQVPAHEVDVLDPQKQEALDLGMITAYKAKLEQIIEQFYRLTFDMFGQPPSFIYAGNIAKLAHRYGAGFFEMEKGISPDKPAEIKVMTAATSAASPVVAVAGVKVTKVKAPKVPKVVPAVVQPQAPASA